MKEQLRTEAEKVLEKSIGRIDAKVLNVQKDWIINAMLDFHAQQSKQDITDEEIETLASNWFESFENTEKKSYTKYDVFKAGFLTRQSQQSKPNTEAIDRLKSIIEACPKGSFFRKELSKVLKDLQIK